MIAVENDRATCSKGSGILETSVYYNFFCETTLGISKYLYFLGVVSANGLCSSETPKNTYVNKHCSWKTIAYRANATYSLTPMFVRNTSKDFWFFYFLEAYQSDYFRIFDNKIETSTVFLGINWTTENLQFPLQWMQFPVMELIY